MLVADGPGASALVDTSSALPSAAVRHTRTRDLDALRGIVVNAGSANAATGSPGVADALEMTARVEDSLGVPSGSVAVCSTGTIGDRLDMERVLPGIDAALDARSSEGGEDFDRAIRTTDRAGKGGAFRLLLGSSEVRFGVAAKGAGMINPNMATMLAFVTSDACVAADDLMVITREAAAASFNRISVDGQMSPSDTLAVLASGRGRPLAGEDLERFAAAMRAICRWCAIQMVKDGEGADHAVRVRVGEAADTDEAERVVRAIGNSPLVKTAIFGNDANWGRVSQAVGQALAGAPGEVHEPLLSFDGAPAGEPAAEEALTRAEYDMDVTLGRGSASAQLWISDLTYAYVELNAEYHT